MGADDMPGAPTVWRSSELMHVDGKRIRPRTKNFAESNLVQPRHTLGELVVCKTKTGSRKCNPYSSPHFQLFRLRCG